MRRFAWTLGLVGAALVLGFATRTALLGAVDGRGFVLALLGAGALLAFAWADRDEVAVVAGSPAVRHDALAIGLVAAAAVVAALAYGAVRAFDVTVDLTAGRVHTLAPHTDAVLADLPRDVEVIAFFPHGSPLQAGFEALVERFRQRSPRLSVRFVDPLQEPGLARERHVDVEAGEVVLVSGGKEEHVVGRFDEDALVDALVRVTSDEDHVVCWSEGHGEADPDDARSPDGLGAAVLALEGEDFQVMPLRLLTGAVDPACEVVVVARPALDLLPLERRVLLDFVAGGGRALVLLEPGTAPGLSAALRTLGVAVGDDLVVDDDPARRPAGVDDPSVLVLDPREGGGHPVAAALRGAVLLALARSVATVDDVPGVATRVLLRAGPRSEVRPALGAATRLAPADVPVAVAVEVTRAAALVLPDVRDGRVDPAEVRAGVERVVRAVAPERAVVADDVPLAELGLDEAGRRTVAEGLAATLGVTIGVGADDTVTALAERAAAAADARLPALAGPPPAAPPRADGGRVVVIGDASFAGNRGVDFGADLDLFLGSVRWLVADDARLGATAEDVGERLPLTAAAGTLIALLALFVGPGAALAMAAWTAWRRRSG